MSVKIIPSVNPGQVILECPCGYRAFADLHGKAVCPRCNRGAVVEGPHVAVKEPAVPFCPPGSPAPAAKGRGRK
jgi:hypothetical protein